jgi:hypothetical protein
LDRLNFDASLTPRSSHSTFRQVSPLKVVYNNNTKRLSADSLTPRLSAKSGNHSIDNEVVSCCISARTSQSIRVTRMLVLVSTCFLLLNAPAHLCVIALKVYTHLTAPILNEHNELAYYQPAQNLTNEHFVFMNDIHNRTTTNETIIEDEITIHLFYIAVLLTQSISYASYSINFFLYSFSGIAFRTSLRQIIAPLRRH